MTETTQNKHLEDGFTSSIWLLFGAERLYGIYAENLKDAQKRIESKFDDPLQYNRPFIEFKLPASKEEVCIQNRDVYFRKLINDNKDLLVDEGYPIGYMETDILEVESVEKAKGTLLQKYDSYEQPRFITIYEVSRTDINEKPLTFTVKAEAVKAARELAEKLTNLTNCLSYVSWNVAINSSCFFLSFGYSL